MKTSVFISKKVIEAHLLVLLLSIVGMMNVKAQTFTFSPPMQTYTECGSGTDEFPAFQYSNCNHANGTDTYQLGHVHAAVWARNSSTGKITIRVQKCNGYFQNGNSGKVIVLNNWDGSITCTNFTINDNSTDYVTAYEYWSINGTTSIDIFLITSDQVYKFYAGHITITPSYTISASASPSYGGSVSGGGSYANNAMCTLSASAASGYSFVRWLWNGSVISYNSTFSFRVTEDASFVAEFEANTYTISASASPSNGGSVSGAGTYNQGSTCTLYASPNSGYSFTRWTKNGSQVSTSSTYSFTVTQNASYVAEFTQNSYTISASASPSNGGSVSGAGTYNQGSTCTLYASPNSGYSFVRWTKNGSQVSTNSTYSFTVTQNASYVAEFAQNSYTISASASPSNGGSVSGAGTYNQGSTCTLSATANTGYNFVRWTKNGNQVSTNSTYSFTVTENASYVAVFEEDTLPNHWTPNSSGYEDNMTLTGVIQINGVEQQSTDLEVGAFCGEECRGSARPVLFEPTGRYVVLLTIYGNTGDQITFKLYDHNQGMELNLQSPNAVTFGPNGLGSLVNPYVLNFVETVVNYTITAAANPSGGGTISGAGTYQSGSTCTLTATPNNGYTFVNWKENGTVVSTNATYSFTVTGNRNLVANFTSDSGGYYWTVNVNQYPSTMTAIGVILINDVEQTTNALELGVFCGTECRGRERLTYISQMDRYLLFLTMYGNYGDVLSFRLYDHALGQELDVICTNSVTFATNSTLGTVASPYEFSFMEGMQTQTSSLPEGWSWWSTYIEQEGTDGLTQLENSLGENGIMIKSQSDGFTTRYGEYWLGLLSSINNESSYLVQTSGSCEVSLTGPMALPSSHPISLLSGWTWIGYPSSTAMSVNTALSNLSPMENDMLKAQESFSVYYPSIGWFGSLQTIMPGMGLMFESHNTSSVTLTYPTPTRTDALAENVTARANHWRPDVQAYPHNMSVMAVVEVDGEELQSEDYELAAFANGECRGSAKLMYVEQLHRYMAFLTLHGDDEAELSFGLYDKATGMTAYESDARLVFAANAVAGSPADPMVVSFRDMTGIDSFGGTLHVFPNPVNRGSMITIGTVEESDEVRVEIVNALGVVLSTENSTRLPAKVKAPEIAGVYMLKVTCKSGNVYISRVVVK